MPAFTYTALLNGSKKTGVIDARSEGEARSRLAKDGCMSIELARIQRKKNPLDRLFHRVSLVQKLFFTQNLEVMVRTGFSLSMALQTLAQQVSNKYFRSVIEQITDDIKSGVSFSTALQKHPDVFSEIFVSMIAAGEVSGKLEEVLKRLTLQLKKDHQLITKVKNAMTYPIIVVVAMVAVGIAVTIFVIPKLVSVFTESNVELPMLTKILIGASNLLLHQGYYLAIGLVLFVIAISRLLKQRSSRRLADRFVLRLPIAGLIVKKMHLARFSRTLASLLETDIHIVESFQIIAKTLQNSLYRETVERAGEKLKTGATIASVLEEAPDLFPMLLIQMITVGEQSGTLDQVASEIADFYEADVDDTMNNLSTIIEPILMLVIGAAVALLALAILQPIYSLTETI